MVKKNLLVLIIGLFVSGRFCYAESFSALNIGKAIALTTDTIPSSEVMAVVKLVIYAANDFNGQAVANLYTPNAVVADDEPPYSWNGPTAGIQWINAVEKAVKEYHITKFKGSIQQVKVYQQTADNVYVVVPVSYSGNLPGKEQFSARGAFTFVLRLINDKWLIKSQVWMPEKGLDN